VRTTQPLRKALQAARPLIVAPNQSQFGFAPWAAAPEPAKPEFAHPQLDGYRSSMQQRLPQLRYRSSGVVLAQQAIFGSRPVAGPRSSQT
jgi:hypothetical protein